MPRGASRLRRRVRPTMQKEALHLLRIVFSYFNFCERTLFEKGLLSRSLLKTFKLKINIFVLLRLPTEKLVGGKGYSPKGAPLPFPYTFFCNPSKHPHFYNKNPIKIRDMCVDFYALERREHGQGVKRRARVLRERTAFTKTD